MQTNPLGYERLSNESIYKFMRKNEFEVSSNVWSNDAIGLLCKPIRREKFYNIGPSQSEIAYIIFGQSGTIGLSFQFMVLLLF